jgi:hypothetical protein
MSSNIFTPQSLLAIKDKFKDTPLFKIDGEVRAATKTINKKPQVQTHYVPFKCKNLTGKYDPLQVKFTKQIAASGAKLPYNKTYDDASHVQVTFKKLTSDDLDSSDYPENKREELLKLNEEFINVLDLIANEYESLVKREVIPECNKAKGRFKWIKNDAKSVHSFRQTHRKAGDEENQEAQESDENGEQSDKKTDEHSGKIALQTPMYRIRLRAEKNTNKIGYTYNNKFIPTVYDMKKTTQESTASGKLIKVIAKVMSGGRLVDLDIKNVRHFVTYLSLAGGIITFESICISSQGISLLCHFKELILWRHKPLARESMNNAEINDMAEFGVKGDDGDVNVDEAEEAEEEESKSKSKQKGKSFAGKKTSKFNKSLDDEEEDSNEVVLAEPDENNDGNEDDNDDLFAVIDSAKTTKSKQKTKVADTKDKTSEKKSKAAESKTNEIELDEETEETEDAEEELGDESKELDQAEADADEELDEDQEDTTTVKEQKTVLKEVPKKVAKLVEAKSTQKQVPKKPAGNLKAAVRKPANKE